jgi:hypothetical protein
MLEQSKDNCRIWLGKDLSFYGQIWQVDASTVELIAFTKEASEGELATTSHWLIPIRSILAIGFDWHTLRDREQTLQATTPDPLFKKST